VYPYEGGIRVVQTDNGSEFKNLHLSLLLEDIDEFNNLLRKIAGYKGIRKLMDYLVWYNTERPHKNL